MKFRVHVLSRANRGVDRIVWWIARRRQSPEGAIRWYRAYRSCLKRLTQVADQQPLAPENENAWFEVRETTFKTRYGSTY